MKRVILAALSVACLAAGLTAWAYHEYSYGNNVNPSALGQGAADGASSRELVAVGWFAGCNALEAIQDVFIGNSAGRESGQTQKAVGIGYNALGDAHDIKNVVAIGNYELAGISGVTNTTSINNGQIFVSETYDIAMIRPNCYAAPSNSPFAYIGGNTFIGGTGTTYIAGNVVFGGRTVVQDNSYVGGGGATARLAGSGDLANMTVPYSSGDCSIFVSPSGSDTADGSLLRPFLTLTRAIREANLRGILDQKIGVMAGEYAYPSNDVWQASGRLGIRLIGLEGADKTRISLTATGISPETQWAAVLDGTVEATLLDKGCLAGSAAGTHWNYVIGFTLDGRTRRSVSDYTYGTYSAVYFKACKFTGIDAARLRRNGFMMFSNCIIEDCHFLPTFQVSLRFRSYADSNAFFACSFVNTIVENIRKCNGTGDFNSSDGSCYDDCEFINSLCVDTNNTWQAAMLYEVTDYSMYDSTVVFKKNSLPIREEGAASRRHGIIRSIFAVGDNTAKSATWSMGYGYAEDSYTDSWNGVKAITDGWFYPLDDAIELFGIGYNNGLTRRFKDYLRTREYQGRDGVGIIDLKNTDSMLLKCEGGDLNIYTVHSVSNDIPVRPLFALFKAESAAGNDVYVSSSLGDRMKAADTPDPVAKFVRRTAVNHGDNENE